LISGFVAEYATAYLVGVIKSIRHKGLKRFFDTGVTSGIQAEHRKKLRLQLAALDTATIITDMNLPGFRLHRLKGDRVEFWAIDVSANWRLTFRFDSGNVYDLDYEDYH
jgi:proteic killer suppression protein